jgi:site-specific recombinase XerD
MKQPISPLRQRMIDDMTMRNLSPNTQETYIRSVAQFSAFHRRSPDKLGVKHVRDFHLHLVSRSVVANSIAVKMAALRFFYGTTLRRPDIAAEIPTPRRRIVCRRFLPARRSSDCSRRWAISSCERRS